ncbi:adenosylcobinamide-GDP ribazoletransferase [Sulfitobacter undariae]|uniref:Adenosylcobinamide-GDP ribazoletransferase n=1 Tax=Sulfitobacter undariae TaxID=1563671 RepID=A0A7W6E6L0_9RHOB|nr:adenosylcobinamide-GDP ribazoletransferase [Sulfitobacter undariae]MBB3993597.1 adenosylcobinamide-GDP ribazoletransferase [Sulfitobacter undariae]
MDKPNPIRQIWLAAVLLTRLPLPRLPASAFADGAQAVWSYPLVGLAVGAAGGLTAHLALLTGLPSFAAAALGLAMMIMITGAMHEDGLADVFDGFWGGFIPSQRLEIMRDSQIGTYGVLALLTVFTLRLTAIAALLEHNSLFPIFAAAAVSRVTMPVLMYALPHARQDGLAHSVGRPSIFSVALSCGIAAVIALLCLGETGIIALSIAAGVTFGVGHLAKRKIGGQSGDVLGAAQQISEAAILMVCAALLL